MTGHMITCRVNLTPYLGPVDLVWLCLFVSNEVALPF